MDVSGIIEEHHASRGALLAREEDGSERKTSLNARVCVGVYSSDLTAGWILIFTQVGGLSATLYVDASKQFLNLKALRELQPQLEVFSDADRE